MIRRLVISAMLVVAPAAYAGDPCSEDLDAGRSAGVACNQLLDLILSVTERVDLCRDTPGDPGSAAWLARFRVCQTAAHQAECRLDRCFQIGR